MYRIFLTFMLLLTVSVVCADSLPQTEKSTVWHDMKTLNIEGRGWSDPTDFYTRFPDKAQSRVTEHLWFLASDSSGIMARFITDSDEIKVRWKLKNALHALPHMADTGVSGVDLYVKYKSKWHWLGTGMPGALENERSLIAGLPCEKREYALYLPLYNGVNSVEIGVSSGTSFEKAPNHKKYSKPVVFYGSSILQGACASRPGMAYPSILGRRFDIETINLGFSGSGRCEKDVADLLVELDPQVYVIDCMPNMEASYVYERISYLLKELKQKHPNTPVILVEHPIYQYTFIFGTTEPKNDVLRKVYKDVKSEWNGKLYYVKCDKLYGTDGEATVDGVHATDVGFMRMADEVGKTLLKALKNS